MKHVLFRRFLNSSFLILTFLPLAHAAPPAQPPVITGYQIDQCAAKGQPLVVLGLNFGNGPGDRHVVLWSASTSVQPTVTLWRDNQITVAIPDDRRIHEGGRYQIGIQGSNGTWVGGLGPMFLICTNAPAR
jgi:hypothetical protein